MMPFPNITRRNLLLSAPFLMAGKSFAANPWSARILRGNFDGKAHSLGLALALSPGWKTYWRVPGPGGIAPEFNLSGENLKTFTASFPLPLRLHNKGEEIIGYENEVVFPLRVEPLNPDAPLSLNLSAFLGVCETVCIPAQFAQQVDIALASPPLEDLALLQRWQDLVPRKKDTGPVTAALTTSESGMPAIRLALSEPVADLFIEGSAKDYFRAPQIKGLEAIVIVDGVKKVSELSGQTLRITLATGKGGLEQEVKVT